MKILIIEDDPMFGNVLTKLLELQGHQSMLESKLENIDVNNELDLIMVDFSCIDIYSFLDKCEDSSNVIVMGGDIDDDDKIKLNKKGVFKILDKPFRMDKLKDILTENELVKI